MTVKKYDWGSVISGSSSGVPSTASYGSPEVFTGSLTGDSTLTFSSETKSVTIHNTHDTEHLEASLDGGSTWIDFGPYGTQTYNVSISKLMLRLVSGNSTYAVVAALA